MTNEARPIGVTILAVLVALSAFGALVLGAIFFAVIPLIREVLPIPRAIAAIAGGILIVIGLIGGVFAWGLWTGQGWAWTATLILTGISTIANLLWLPLSILRLLLDVLILYYLTRPYVKQYFRQEVIGVTPSTLHQYTYQPPTTPPMPSLQQTTKTDEPRFCGNCGSPLTVGASFCSTCGKQVGTFS